ncbi:MAG: glycoside hydrolase family 9 protein [Pseudomonadota bacterium]
MPLTDIARPTAAITETWPGGYKLEMTIVNDTDAVLDGWSAYLAGDYGVYDVWGATAERLEDGLRLTSVAEGADGWGHALAPGERVTVGFVATGTPPASPSVTAFAPGGAIDLPVAAAVAGTDLAAMAAVVEAWTGGFKAEVAITNDGPDPISGWSLDLAGGSFDIFGVWGAAVASDGGGLVSVAAGSNAWGHTIQPGQTVTVGFVADGAVPATLSAVITAEDGDAPAAPAPDQTPDPAPAPDPAPDPTPDPTPAPPSDLSGADPDSPFDAGDYAEATGLSMTFFYANYAGDLPEDFRFDWRGDSTLDDGADVGRDLSGGWFDAGDHVKFGFPMAATATLLAWGGEEFEDGYETAGAMGDLEQHLRFVTDYFLQAYDDRGTASVSDDVLHVQVGHGPTDHGYWGSPEEMDLWRPTYSVDASKPGSDVAGETAAALAASAMFFRERGDDAYADRLLGQAETLFAFAETYQGKYSDSVPEANPFYTSVNGYRDELSWAATFLYEATGDQSYLDKAEDYYDGNWYNGAIQFDNKENGVALRLAQLTGDARYEGDIDRHLDHWIDDIARTPGTATNDGMGWLTEWGSAVLAANTGFLATLRAKDVAEAGGDGARVAELRDFASDQADYILGDNPDGYSYLIGFGDDFPENPHHRAASGTTNMGDPAPNAHELTGALVGGPSRDGSFEDDRGDWVRNEVGTTYNAGFSGLAAGLVEGLSDGGEGGWLLG